ncbi:hypothetical protein GCM10027037_15340 [Mucilaginibacter koreensis]
MKVVIIGGGIAGLTLGALLHDRSIEFSISERNLMSPSHGHAFLMHTDGLAILNELSTEHQIDLPGNYLDTYRLSRPDGQEIKRVPLLSWKSIKRQDMLHFLTSLVPKGSIIPGRQFSHFNYENGKAVEAVFMNGDVERGDLFIGADGSNSKVRQEILGKTTYTPTEVKEIVGIAPNTPSANSELSLFNKIQDLEKGLSFGYIPVSEQELVWFMQYDATADDVSTKQADELAAFCKAQLKDFPLVVKEILDANDFNTTYLWNTTDFDLLPQFHHNNVAVIGDAAHLALPFTSSGTTNAVIDAKVLVDCLDYTTGYEQAFNKFYKLRAAEVQKHTELGRQLKKVFLNPEKEAEIPIPLISRKRVKADNPAQHNPIKVLYFTDPICSTCWIIQPQLRKLKLEYGDYLNIQYCMGGLLSCWEDGNTGSIKSPDDAARHWEEACRNYDMPMDGDVWIEDPLHSSYPPSIAFKAAQLQDEGKAVKFLRRIQEMVFLEKKNIIKWKHIENAAFDAGLDCIKLLSDFGKRAQENFRADLALAKQYGVTGFPTLFFSDGSGKQFMLRGNQPYEQFESIVTGLLSNAQKKPLNHTPAELFEQFSTLTGKEFAVLTNTTKAEATQALETLLQEGHIERHQSKNGVIWKYKSLISQ